MSLFCLTNKTGSDVQLDWANNFTFPNNTSIDLINEGSYGDPATDYNIGIDTSDIIGRYGGMYYDSIKELIKDGNWKLGDGTREYYYEEALHLLGVGCLSSYTHKGISKTIVSHDLCQPTTWYQNATQVTDEVVTKVDDHYRTKYKNLICLQRGFLYQEDAISFQEDFNIKVNGTIVTDPTKFNVEPISGIITFEEGFITVPETDVVTCSYEYGKSSIYEVQTDDTHMWRILKTEIQLDSEIIINKPITMEVVIDHPVAGDNYVASKWVYKNVRDFISGSNLGFVVPAFGGTKEDAGYTGNVIILPFNYTTPSELPVGVNARIRLRIEDDIAPIGKFGTVTFYMDKIKL